ncbi:hypothetical protein T484DRAFT_1764413, partial [Baffinella frigidus]
SAQDQRAAPALLEQRGGRVVPASQPSSKVGSSTPPGGAEDEVRRLQKLVASMSAELSITDDETLEVRRLQKLVANMSAELGKQLGSVSRGAEGDTQLGQQFGSVARGGEGDFQARAEWLQKLVLQMEAKGVGQEGEIREAKAQSQRVLRKMDTVEQENNALHGQQARPLREPLSGGAPENNALREQQARSLRESRTGGAPGSSGGDDASRQMMRERDSLRGQYEELQNRHSILQRSLQLVDEQKTRQNRHSILQRSLQLVDEQKTVEQRGAAESSRRVAEMEMRQSSLVNQTNLLAKENQILREQRTSEMSKFDTQRKQLMQQRDGVQIMQQRDVVQASHDTELEDAQLLIRQLQSDNLSIVL